MLFGRDPIYVYDDDNHQAVPSPDECPFHQLPLPDHISKQGWAFVKCPVQPCAVFLDEKAAPTLLDQLRQQKHPQLTAGRGTADDPQPPLMCFCNESLALRISRTAKNPGRLFLGCKSQKCAFFQWTDEPWSQSLRDRWAQVLRHLVHKKKTEPFFLSLSVNSRCKWIKPKRCVTSFFTKKICSPCLTGRGLGWGGVGERL